MTSVWATCTPCNKTFYCYDHMDNLDDARRWRLCPVCMTPGQVIIDVGDAAQQKILPTSA